MPIYVAILGTDTMLAVRPVEPLQLIGACHAAGFDLVAPVSWGEELVASHLGDRMAEAGRTAAVASSCPFVSERLRTAPVRTLVVTTVSPPVACARYVRAMFGPRQVHVSYVGACPGAFSAEIDDRYLPEMLIARLLEAGIDPARQPRQLDGQLPVERARYASVPGGAPDADWLRARTGEGARLIEAAPITVDAVAGSPGDVGVLMDLAAACRCVCARDRAGAARLEPERAPLPVVAGIAASLAEAEPGRAWPSTEPARQATTGDPAERDRRARFAENGLSAGEVSSLSSIPDDLTTSREPW